MGVLREFGELGNGEEVFGDPVLPGDRLTFNYEEAEGEVAFGISKSGQRLMIKTKGEFRAGVLDFDSGSIRIDESSGIVSLDLSKVRVLFMWVERSGIAVDKTIMEFHHKLY